MKEYKCNFKHCDCDETLTDENREVLSGKSYHKKCLQTKNDIIEIRDYYISNVSNTVVVGMLVKTINNIIFDKKVDSQFLKFALEYAVFNNISIKSPFSLHYLIDNSRIKTAWTKEQTKENEIKKSTEIIDDFDFETNVISTSIEATQGGFGDILKRR